MRIAHVTATFPPYWAGTGNVAYHNARLLHERNHQVTVFTAEGRHDGATTFPFEVERLPAVLRLGNAPLTLGLVTRLRGFDLIHLHYPYIFGSELTLLAAKRYGTPVVLTYHNQLRDRTVVKNVLFRAYNLAFERAALRSATAIFAVRRDHLLSIHPGLAGTCRIREIPNGVDTAVFTPTERDHARRELGLPLEAPIALFVGALDRAHRFKNVEGLLRAFAAVPNDQAHLLVVGDGDLRPRLQAMSTALGVGDRVRFMGSRPPDRLPLVYSAADVTVLPSTEVESFGLVLIESMACATPVIVSKLPGVHLVLASSGDGLTVNPGDERDLAEKLGHVLSDRARAARMGRQARRTVVERYDWRQIVPRLEQAYASALAGGAAA